MTASDALDAPVVAADGLAVALDGSPILHEVGLSVRAGQMVAVLGGNGSGKTTLLRAVLGLVPHQAGQVRLFGQPLGEFRAWGRIGYVPQHGGIEVGTATIREVVTSGRLPHRRLFRPLQADDRAAIAEALARLNLTGLENQPLAHLSGGQRQRTLIARALATRPDLVVLDEPLAGLDTATQDGLAEVLAGLKKTGTAVLVVLHELGPLETLLDHSIVLQQGRVIYNGPLRSGPADEPRHMGAHHHAHDAEDAPAAAIWPGDPVAAATAHRAGETS